MKNVIEKYLEAKKTSSESLNCISALFYLIGLDPNEIPHNMDDFKLIQKQCKQVKSAKEADIVYIPFPTEHFMVLDPSDKDYILHRNWLDQPLIRETLDDVIRSIHPWIDWERCQVYYKIES